VELAKDGAVTVGQPAGSAPLVADQRHTFPHQRRRGPIEGMTGSGDRLRRDCLPPRAASRCRGSAQEMPAVARSRRISASSPIATSRSWNRVEEGQQRER
jgi:hypothetical protein